MTQITTQNIDELFADNSSSLPNITQKQFTDLVTSIWGNPATVEKDFPTIKSELNKNIRQKLDNRDKNLTFPPRAKELEEQIITPTLREVAAKFGIKRSLSDSKLDQKVASQEGSSQKQAKNNTAKLILTELNAALPPCQRMNEFSNYEQCDAELERLRIAKDDAVTFLESCKDQQAQESKDIGKIKTLIEDSHKTIIDRRKDLFGSWFVIKKNSKDTAAEKKAGENAYHALRMLFSEIFFGLKEKAQEMESIEALAKVRAEHQDVFAIALKEEIFTKEPRLSRIYYLLAVENKNDLTKAMPYLMKIDWQYIDKKYWLSIDPNQASSHNLEWPMMDIIMRCLQEVEAHKQLQMTLKNKTVLQEGTKLFKMAYGTLTGNEIKLENLEIFLKRILENNGLAKELNAQQADRILALENDVEQNKENNLWKTGLANYGLVEQRSFYSWLLVKEYFKNRKRYTQLVIDEKLTKADLIVMDNLAVRYFIAGSDCLDNSTFFSARELATLLRKDVDNADLDGNEGMVSQVIQVFDRYRQLRKTIYQKKLSNIETESEEFEALDNECKALVSEKSDTKENLRYLKGNVERVFPQLRAKLYGRLEDKGLAKIKELYLNQEFAIDYERAPVVKKSPDSPSSFLSFLSSPRKIVQETKPSNEPAAQSELKNTQQQERERKEQEEKVREEKAKQLQLQQQKERDEKNARERRLVEEEQRKLAEKHEQQKHSLMRLIKEKVDLLQGNQDLVRKLEKQINELGTLASTYREKLINSSKPYTEVIANRKKIAEQHHTYLQKFTTLVAETKAEEKVEVKPFVFVEPGLPFAYTSYADAITQLSSEIKTLSSELARVRECADVKLQENAAKGAEAQLEPVQTSINRLDRNIKIVESGIDNFKTQQEALKKLESSVIETTVKAKTPLTTKLELAKKALADGSEEQDRLLSNEQDFEDVIEKIKSKRLNVLTHGAAKTAVATKRQEYKKGMVDIEAKKSANLQQLQAHNFDTRIEQIDKKIAEKTSILNDKKSIPDEFKTERRQQFVSAYQNAVRGYAEQFRKDNRFQHEKLKTVQRWVEQLKPAPLFWSWYSAEAQKPLLTARAAMVAKIQAGKDDETLQVVAEHLMPKSFWSFLWSAEKTQTYQKQLLLAKTMLKVEFNLRNVENEFVNIANSVKSEQTEDGIRAKLGSFYTTANEFEGLVETCSKAGKPVSCASDFAKLVQGQIPDGNGMPGFGELIPIKNLLSAKTNSELRRSNLAQALVGLEQTHDTDLQKHKQTVIDNLEHEKQEIVKEKQSYLEKDSQFVAQLQQAQTGLGTLDAEEQLLAKQSKLDDQLNGLYDEVSSASTRFQPSSNIAIRSDSPLNAGRVSPAQRQDQNRDTPIDISYSSTPSPNSAGSSRSNSPRL